MKSFDYWTKECDNLAMQEGWLLTNFGFADQDIACICRLDDPACVGLDYDDPKFNSDMEAENFVLQKASEGSMTHLLAVWLSGRSIDDPLPEYFTRANTGD